jgi:hypothetical protein
MYLDISRIVTVIGIPTPSISIRRVVQKAEVLKRDGYRSSPEEPGCTNRCRCEK